MAHRPSHDAHRLVLVALAPALLAVLGMLWMSGRNDRTVPHATDPAPARLAPGQPAAGIASPATPMNTVARTSTPLQRDDVELHGVVRDAGGAPVADVLVTLNGPGEADHEVRSNARGTFSIEHLAPARYQFVAVAPHVLTTSGFVAFGAADAPVEWTVEVDRGVPMGGRVLDEAARPVEGACITPLRHGPCADEYDHRCSVRTDGNGRFELHGASNCDTFVLVEHENFAATTARLHATRAALVQLRTGR